MKIEIPGSRRFAIQTGTVWEMQKDGKLLQLIPKGHSGTPFILDDSFIKVGNEFRLNGELKHVTSVEYAVTPLAIVFQYEFEDGRAPPLPTWLTIFDDPRR